ncbi:MAG TPA: BCCT family transporter [Rubrobacteraceae bacterium]|nr:BCCT family transporter [Rubrobacteraceae bacterium]
MQEYLRRHTNPPVFIISGVVILAFVAAGVLFTGATETVAGAVQGFITTYFGWFYIIGVSLLLIFTIGLLFTRYGRVRLGPDDSRPEFSTWAWFAMLFTAGMGIGLVYFGVAEPVAHFISPPVGEGGTDAAARQAMNLTFFHWLLHPWAIYIVFGLSLAYFSFRRGLPLRPASAFYPLIGDRIYGWVGNLVDILAVFGTMFGLATSLGLGAQQVNSGLNTLFGIPNNTAVQIILIAIITGVAAVSVVLGIDRGIRNLSLINMWLAIGLALFVFLVGPTLFILNSLATDLGYYLQNLVGTSFNMYTGNEAGAEWQAGWTLFYWGWWISWAPFVGMFIARISRGRTLREFVGGVLFAPVGASAVWFVIFGETAINYLRAGTAGGLADADSSNALFVLLQALPVASIISVIASVVGIIVVVLFFATSSDSGSLVIDILTNGGDPDPVWYQRLFWAILEGVVAAVLLLVGGLSALQTASITAGLPFAVVLLLMCVGLAFGLRDERLPSIQPEPTTAGRTPPEPGRVADRPRGTPEPMRTSAENPQDRGPGRT